MDIQKYLKMETKDVYEALLKVILGKLSEGISLVEELKKPIDMKTIRSFAQM